MGNSVVLDVHFRQHFVPV